MFDGWRWSFIRVLFSNWRFVFPVSTGVIRTAVDELLYPSGVCFGCTHSWYVRWEKVEFDRVLFSNWRFVFPVSTGVIRTVIDELLHPSGVCFGCTCGWHGRRLQVQRQFQVSTVHCITSYRYSDITFCLLAGSNLWKRMLLKCSVTMVFTCPLLPWCKILSPFKENNTVVFSLCTLCTPS